MQHVNIHRVKALIFLSLINVNISYISASLVVAWLHERMRMLHVTFIKVNVHPMSSVVFHQHVGGFYHPVCLTIKIYPLDLVMAVLSTLEIAYEDPFMCAIHKYHLCQGYENKDDYELQFALCIRCPKAYIPSQMHNG